MADPYVFPGTDVLIDKEGIRSADELAVLETEIPPVEWSICAETVH